MNSIYEMFDHNELEISDELARIYATRENVPVSERSQWFEYAVDGIYGDIMREANRIYNDLTYVRNYHKR